MPGLAEPHELLESEFFDQVHSFDFWLQAVEGYLLDTTYGRDADLVDEPLDDAQREALITTLCNYCIGETAALEASSGMIGYAPSRAIKIFLATQVVDEGRHLEVFLHRLRELGVADPITQQVLIGVIKDERRHIGFGENDLGRRLALTPHLRPRLQKIKRQLDMLVMETFAGTLRETGVPEEEQKHFTSNYLAAVSRLGVDL